MRTNRKRFAMLGLAIAGLIAASAGDSRASIVATLNPGSGTVLSSGSYLYEYTISVNPDQSILTNDYFTIVDFFGEVAGSISGPAGWMAIEEATSPVPFAQTYTDSAAITNLRFVYTGASPIPGGTNNYGTFSARSTVPVTNSPQQIQTAEAHKINDVTGEYTIVAGNTTQVLGPAAPGVPEPTTVLSCVAGLGLLGLGRWVRSRRTA